MAGIFNALIYFLFFLTLILLVIKFLLGRSGTTSSTSSSGILGRIKSKKLKLSRLIPKTPLFKFFWLCIILLALGGVYNLFSPDFFAVSPDNIVGMNREDIFVDGEDGRWKGLTPQEQEKYAVLIIPDEGRTIFFWRDNMNSFFVDLGKHRYPFNIKGKVDDGYANNKFVLQDIKQGESYGAIHTGQEIPCDLVPLGFQVVCRWTTIEVYSGGDDCKEYSAKPGLIGNTFKVYAVINVPKGGMVMTRNLEVVR
jgi:hypothetical protein